MLLSILMACADVRPVAAETSDEAASRIVMPNGGALLRPLAARLTASVVAGSFPLEVSLDASSSDLGSGRVRYEWSFGDGAASVGASSAVHTYVGEGLFEASVTVVDVRNGRRSTADVTVDVEAPGCPAEASPVVWGHVDDGGLTELSGIVTSRIDPEAYWVHEDSGQTPEIIAMNQWGNTLGTYTLPDDFSDFEDLAAAVDPETGISTLFLGDIGDNARARSEIAVWVTEEPDPHADGDLEPLRMALEYPDGAKDSETLLVDPLTFDLYVVTKSSSGSTGVYVKRAPHDDEGPHTLEHVGTPSALAITATAGDVSPDGLWVVVRDYSDTARLFVRDGYAPLEDAFDGSYCSIDIAGEQQGEAIAFDAGGGGLITVSEGTNEPLNFVGL